MTQLSKERLETIAAWREKYGENHNVMLPATEAQEMARRLLAAEAREPVRYLNKFTGVCVTLEQQPDAATDTAVYVPLLAAPQPLAVPNDIPPHVLDAMSDMCDGGFDAQGIWDLCRAAHQPSSGALQLVGEVVARNHPNHERNVDFRWLDFNVDPGTKLYAIKQERS